MLCLEHASADTVALLVRYLYTDDIPTDGVSGEVLNSLAGLAQELMLPRCVRMRVRVRVCVCVLSVLRTLAFCVGCCFSVRGTNRPCTADSGLFESCVPSCLSAFELIQIQQSVREYIALFFFVGGRACARNRRTRMAPQWDICPADTLCHPGGQWHGA